MQRSRAALKALILKSEFNPLNSGSQTHTKWRSCDRLCTICAYAAKN